MNWQDYIVSDQHILSGKPTIKGTRISVELLLELLSNGWSEQQLLQFILRFPKTRCGLCLRIFKPASGRNYIFQSPIQRSVPLRWLLCSSLHCT